MREGQGSYFYAQKNKLFVGEYVEDNPKAGIYTEVEENEYGQEPKERGFDDIPPIPVLGLRDPIKVLEKSFQRVRQRRVLYRAKYMSIGHMFLPNELETMRNLFSSVSEWTITAEQLHYLLDQMGIEVDRSLGPNPASFIPEFLSKIEPSVPDKIDFELFARTVALVLEENNKLPDHEMDALQEEEETEEEEPKHSTVKTLLSK